MEPKPRGLVSAGAHTFESIVAAVCENKLRTVSIKPVDATVREYSGFIDGVDMHFHVAVDRHSEADSLLRTLFTSNVRAFSVNTF